jgi:dihydrofolate synthase/folylpolyglutamate synthase
VTYEQTLDYMFSHLPMFQRQGPAAYKADLANTEKLMELTGHPHLHFPSIHIAGTNGKGSTSHALAAILQSAGYKTGLYTSPHLKDYRERIRINGAMIEPDYVTAFVEKFRNDFDVIAPSFFEMSVALAFSWFRDMQVDVAVIETGLGGRLDSTNVITPILSVITNISLDHTALLGPTNVHIAGEKAGIIKQGVPVVIGESHEETVRVFQQKAQSEKASITFADADWQFRIIERGTHSMTFDLEHRSGKKLHDMTCDLTGFYQEKNMKTVFESLRVLTERGLTLNEESVRKGLKNVKSFTGLAGRWHVLQTQPLTVADTAHNEGGLTEVMEQIRHTPHQKLHMVIGVVADKDLEAMLKLLPSDACYYFCRPDLPRGLDAEDLRMKAVEFGLEGMTYPSVKEALQAAKEEAGSADMIYVGGSTFVVAEAI